ncbi:MAG: PcfB family protein [Lachnospiraceae bacterium]|nr:PcfB family protein [Lachnospiraceae bacterium]
MNEEIAEKTVRLAITLTKVTGRGLLAALKAGIKTLRVSNDRRGKGQQTVKQLIKQGSGASSMDISGKSLGTFKRIANKYGVDFAIVKTKDNGKNHYNVFYKAKDMDAIVAVVNEYSKKIVNKKEKTSIIKSLNELKEKVAKRAKEPMNRNRENVR